MDSTYIGKVVWFNEPKGYGFVQVDNVYKDLGGKEVFYHRKSIVQNNGGKTLLNKGDVVSFEIKNGKKLSAIKLQKINSYE